MLLIELYVKFTFIQTWGVLSLPQTASAFWFNFKSINNVTVHISNLLMFVSGYIYTILRPLRFFFLSHPGR